MVAPGHSRSIPSISRRHGACGALPIFGDLRRDASCMQDSMYCVRKSRRRGRIFAPLWPDRGAYRFRKGSFVATKDGACRTSTPSTAASPGSGTSDPARHPPHGAAHEQATLSAGGYVDTSATCSPENSSGREETGTERMSTVPGAPAAVRRSRSSSVQFLGCSGAQTRAENVRLGEAGGGSGITADSLKGLCGRCGPRVARA